MDLDFRPIRLEDQEAYGRISARCPQLTSDYSFANLWGWAKEYGLQMAWSDDLVWIHQQHPQPRHWAPIGDWDRIDWSPWEKKLSKPSLLLTRIPQALVETWQTAIPHGITVEERRDHWDYIYSSFDLRDLKGNRFHKKKNLLNQFKKKYAFQYYPLDNDRIDHALSMQADWCTFRDCESHATLAAENRVIARILGKWKELANLVGGCLMVDGRMVAYTVGEPLAADTLMIHFEKGDSQYRGIYQAINQMFIQDAAADYAKINREQDLGDAGLRKAKLSYHPIELQKKYAVTFRGP